jgi:hypothetical protein
VSRLIIHPKNGGSDRTWYNVIEIVKGNGETITFKTKQGIAVTVSRETDWILIEGEVDASPDCS